MRGLKNVQYTVHTHRAELFRKSFERLDRIAQGKDSRRPRPLPLHADAPDPGYFKFFPGTTNNRVKFSNLNRQFYTHFCRLRTTQNGAVWQSQHLYNCIPEAVRKLPMRRFKEVLKSFLLKKAFYSLDEFTTIGSKEHFQL
ncbi:uncharacterized protein LOC116173201 isoform X1 [Photinus pyralis]|uniref:uncharacterized protein LOC116173201 isoform X1 n=1 Tax=Photinus pyralis TaxID=7054 RepID=UPI0012677E01|nr:uncharacterized protein LOC116173201 isoform X1 [Photinus pyralis]